MEGSEKKSDIIWLAFSGINECGLHIAGRHKVSSEVTILVQM